MNEQQTVAPEVLPTPALILNFNGQREALDELMMPSIINPDAIDDIAQLRAYIDQANKTMHDQVWAIYRNKCLLKDMANWLANIAMCHQGLNQKPVGEILDEFLRLHVRFGGVQADAAPTAATTH